MDCRGSYQAFSVSLFVTGVGSGTHSWSFYLAMHVPTKINSIKLALLSYVRDGVIDQASTNRSMYVAFSASRACTNQATRPSYMYSGYLHPI